MRYHADDRREFWGDIFPCEAGDINIVRPRKGIPIAWHRHQKQDDRIFLVQGVLRLRLFKDHPDDGSEFFLWDTVGDRLPYWITRNHWHGYEALTDDTVVLQFNGPSKWDGSDEERHPIDAEMPWD